MTRKIVVNGGVLERHTARYCAYLNQRHYSSNTQQSYARCVAHFDHWITRRHFQLLRIDEQVVEKFINSHLNSCDCRFPVRRRAYDNKAALRHLLDVLRIDGVISQFKQVRNAIDREVLRFDSYMDRTCGLAHNTRYQWR